MEPDLVTITMTKNEALILFDYLSTFNETTTEKDFTNKAEQIVLWNIEAILEAHLPEVLQSNYLEIIEKARQTFNG